MKCNKQVRILLVDDHRVVLDGLSRLLNDCEDFLVVGGSISHEEAIAAALQQKPDVVLLDVRLPGIYGFETCRELKRILPSAKVLMLTSFADDAMILEAIRCGAEGYLLKEIDGEELVAAIRKVIGGGILFDPSVTRGLLRQIDARKTPCGIESLTAREKNLLRAVAEGQTNRQIAEHFHLTEGTVRNYLSTVFEKIGVSRRAQAVAEYMRNGATPLDPPVAGPAWSREKR